MTAREYLQWVALIQIVEPRELEKAREQAKAEAGRNG